MSVENFIQESFFEDIFPPVTATPAPSNFQQRQARPRRLEAGSSGSAGSSESTEAVRGRAALRSVIAVAQPSLPDFRVVRSTRRKRGVTAFRNNGLIEIHIPDRTTRRDEAALIPEMIALVLEREARQRRGDELLAEMAGQLLAQYLPEFHERPSSIRWRSMQGRWGSCTTVDGTIRIAGRLASAPDYVLNCVLIHELIHLRLPGHGPEFYALLARYPDLARAEAYLEGFEAGLASAPDQISPQELDSTEPSL